MKSAIVSSKELGTNCWSAHRFCGGRCNNVMWCSYPEKATCKAVQAEIDYLKDYYKSEIEKLQEQFAKSMQKLGAEL